MPHTNTRNCAIIFCICVILVDIPKGCSYILNTMKARKIAILVDTATGWGRRSVRGALDYATECGPWDVWIEPKGRDEIIKVPTEGDFEGIIARIASEETAQQLSELDIPTVNISGLQLNSETFPRVTVDTPVAVKLAEKHFRDRAFRNFAYVGPMSLPYVHKHEQAFEQLLSESGTRCYSFQPEPGKTIAYPWPANDTQFIPWLKSLPKPVGIYTWGYQIGRDIISACRSAEIPIPHDVAVLGGDFDELLCDACHPPLSGVVTPARRIGYEAAAILDTMMNGEAAPQAPLFIPPEEVAERLSTDTLAIDDPHMLQAVAYLSEHACEDINVENILKEVPIARRALERKFMQYLGRSPVQEIRRIRINHARKLLAKTNLSMQEVAEACGYASYTYLGNVFKNETGISPGKYRREALNRAP